MSNLKSLDEAGVSTLFDTTTKQMGGSSAARPAAEAGL
jgi:hypothetical protein